MIVDPTNDRTSFFELETERGFFDERKDYWSRGWFDTGVTGI
jgi:hypothetical protein